MHSWRLMRGRIQFEAVARDYGIVDGSVAGWGYVPLALRRGPAIG